MSLPRLRQAVLVAADLSATCAELESAFELRRPFADPGIREFGLSNAVYEVGDCFLEVVSPVRDGTAAGRFLARNGGDGGYMAIYQVADGGAARDRIAGIGARIVWKADLDDITATHIHPKDAGGAIVSIDEARPAESWRWGGPRWIGGAPADRDAGGLSAITVAVVACVTIEARWREAIGGLPATQFVEGEGGIVEIVLDRPSRAGVAVDVGAAVVRAA